MASKLVIPHFPSEDAEAEWLWKHRRELEKEMLRRMKEGTTYRRPGDNPEFQSITIRIPKDDIESARRQATKHGVGYQTYIRAVLHQALQSQKQGRK